MSRLRVVIAADGMSAEVEATPGPAGSRADLELALQQAKVAHGIDQDAVTALAARLADERYSGRIRIARGTPPVPGKDGLLVLCAALHPIAGEILADGSIDFHERHSLLSAGTGEEVARWHKPEPGTPGQTVRGTEVAVPKPKENRPVLGKGVKGEDDGRILALRDGVVTCVPGKGLDVLDLYQHAGDVDLESGNLHARGSLHVKGNVQEGAMAEADGDLMIQGTVFNGMLRAGGNLTVVAGVMGTESEIHAGGDLACRHATNALLQAKGTIRVRDEMVHCRARAGAIEMLEGRGCVLGGEVRARYGIRVRVAGSPGGATTVLSAADVSDQMAECAAASREHQRAVRPGLKMRHEGSGPGPRPETAAADQAQAARLELLRIKRDLLLTARIEVHGTAWPGVRILFGTTALTLHEPVQATAFRFDPDTETIVQEPL